MKAVLDNAAKALPFLALGTLAVLVLAAMIIGLVLMVVFALLSIAGEAFHA